MSIYITAKLFTQNIHRTLTLNRLPNFVTANIPLLYGENVVKTTKKML